MARTASTSESLRSRYLRYIAALDERRVEDLTEFVAEELTYNGRPTTREQYQDDRREEFRTIPDLRFPVVLLVADDEQVAAKLDFDCTPVSTFLGFEPSGRSIRFTEHVFYRFEGGLITAVTSLIDLAAVERQLAGGARD